MAGDCEQEMCPAWTGDGCLCEVVDLDDDDRDELRRQIEHLR